MAFMGQVSFQWRGTPPIERRPDLANVKNKLRRLMRDDKRWRIGFFCKAGTHRSVGVARHIRYILNTLGHQERDCMYSLLATIGYTSRPGENPSHRPLI